MTLCIPQDSDTEVPATAAGNGPITSTRTAPAHIQAAAATAAKVVAETKAQQGQANENAMPTPKGVYVCTPVHRPPFHTDPDPSLIRPSPCTIEREESEGGRRDKHGT